jgi:hypothetical protein
MLTGNLQGVTGKQTSMSDMSVKNHNPWWLTAGVCHVAVSAAEDVGPAE